MSGHVIKAAAGAGAAAGSSFGPVGMAIGAAAGICIGAAIGWLARGHKENKKHAQNQEIISGLEKRLRKNEELLRDTTGLAADEIRRLRTENSQLHSELRRAKAAA